MNLPFPKSLFLELGRYPLFVDFVLSTNSLHIPLNIDSVEFMSRERKGYTTYLRNNISIVENLLQSFLEKYPVFWGVVFTINKMAAEIRISHDTESKLLQKETFIFNKIKFILDCLIQSKLPDYDANIIRHRIDKGLPPAYDTYDFKNRLISKISITQEETVNNLYDYIVSIADRFLIKFKDQVFKKLNSIMNTEETLKNYFDRVVVINLDRRDDRWAALQDKLSKINWPFKTPERFSAYDGKKLPTPVGWTYGSGTWGCLLSHREVLSRAIHDDLNSILVLEDDIFFAPDFEKKVLSFIKGLPFDWDQIMLGGQFFDNSKVYDISPEIRKVSLCHRAHAYAVRGNFMRYMYSKLCSAYGHVDHIMNTFQERYKVYTPKHFLIGQEGSPSDISGMKQSPDLIRNPPDKDTPVFVIAPDVELHKQVVEADLPLHFGTLTDSGVNAQIHKIAENPKHNVLHTIHDFLISSIWYARSVYPSKYSTILNPEGLLLAQILEAKGKLNLIYIESLDQLKEAIAKYPFGEDLPTQFPEEEKQA
jgi:hypothetical protein